MYIWTEDHEILNIDHYAQVKVSFISDNNYTLSAFTSSESNTPYGKPIARFSNKLDADYAQSLLFKALMGSTGAWDATAILHLSRKWEFVNKFFSDSDPNVWDLLRHCEIRVTGLEELTILYSSECESRLPNSLRTSKEEIEDKLELDVDIKWQLTDEIEW